MQVFTRNKQNRFKKQKTEANENFVIFNMQLLEYGRKTRNMFIDNFAT